MKTIYLIFLSLFMVNCSYIDWHPGDHNYDPGTDEHPDPNDMRDISPQDMVIDMRSGWNLGNAMDAGAKDKTAWGNPLTTKAMIDEIANKGFKTLRLPVTWKYDTGDAPDYLIENDYLNRVEEIANWALDNDMYVILNIHHDDSWFVPTYAEADEVKDRLTKVWKQIATKFKEYNDYLLFETLNEPRHKGTPEEWSGGTAEGRDAVNQYHKAGVDAIRGTGGNNAARKIMVSTYAASTGSAALNDFVIPNDDPNVIVSIHSYYPYQFALEGSDSTWGTQSDKNALIGELDKIYNKFVANGRAVVMGEWGSTFTDNPEDRLAHAKFYATACAERGIAPVWWDNGNQNEFGIFNRDEITWYYSEIAEAVINATDPDYVDPDPIPVETDILYESDFSNGVDGWNTNQFGGGSVTVTAENGVLLAKDIVEGANPWDVQLYRLPFTLEKDATYKFTAVVKPFPGEGDFNLRLTIGDGSGVDNYQPYHSGGSIDLLDDNEYQTYEKEFTMTAETTEGARILFDIGYQTNGLMIQSVKLEKL